MRHTLLAAALLIASPAYADEAMTVAQDISSKWQTAYNNGDAAKVAELYTQNAIWVRPTEIDKGKAEIEKAVWKNKRTHTLATTTRNSGIN